MRVERMAWRAHRGDAGTRHAGERDQLGDVMTLSFSERAGHLGWGRWPGQAGLSVRIANQLCAHRNLPATLTMLGRELKWRHVSIGRRRRTVSRRCAGVGHMRRAERLTAHAAGRVEHVSARARSACLARNEVTHPCGSGGHHRGDRRARRRRRPVACGTSSGGCGDTPTNIEWRRTSRASRRTAGVVCPCPASCGAGGEGTCGARPSTVILRAERERRAGGAADMPCHRVSRGTAAPVSRGTKVSAWG